MLSPTPSPTAPGAIGCRFRLPRLTLLALLSSLAPLVLFDAVEAQRKKDKTKYKPGYWKTDPYTKNDEAVMKKLGYESFGPFTWGDDHSSGDITKMFPEVKMLFVETAHFKLGSSLPTYKLPKGKNLGNKLLKEELKELKKVFPDIKPGMRKLDPWLRLHLFAARLERNYADFSKKLGVKDSDFPEPRKVRRVIDASEKNYMGQGPYLGMRSKFLVLLMAKGGNLARYAAKAKGGLVIKGGPQPQRHYFTKVGSLFFGTSCDCADNNLFNDHAMRCHLLFNTVQSMVDGYKDFYFELPVWCREGLSHWYLRKVDPKEHCFTGIKGRSAKKRYDHKWAAKIKKRVKHGDVTPAAKVLKFDSFGQLTFGDHMAVWSRMDFLLSLGDEKFGRFMGIIKNYIPVKPNTVPTLAQVHAQQEKALSEAYGFDYATLDEKWTAFVLKTYPKK